MREPVRRVSPEEIERQRDFARQVRFHPDRPQTYYIVTYGCQMNAHDSEKLAGMLEDMGLTPAAMALLTSITVMASQGSITSVAPLFMRTVRRRAVSSRCRTE